MTQFLNQIRSLQPNSKDIQASFVVFLVALPLCLGIALASGAPASSGLIAAVIGGFVVGLLSPSEVSVSGPAAGLSILVLSGIKEVGSFELFCGITVLAGLLQIGLGRLRFGVIGSLIPTAVIEGMLAAIGLLIILKQIPHAIGFDADYFGDESFLQKDGDNTFSAVSHGLASLTMGAVIISALSASVILCWPWFQNKFKIFKFTPAALIVVALSILANEFVLELLGLRLQSEHLVFIPSENFFQPPRISTFLASWQWSHLPLVLTICLVGSIETILSLDASEKVDPLKRGVDSSRELYAQGLGNILSGLLGGLPITAVIVRTSANITAGARSRLSGILHATWILAFSLLVPDLLGKIPLAALAVILIFVGFKLTSPKLYRRFILQGPAQWIPFHITIVAILFTDLLIGVLIGFAVGVVFVIKNNLRSAVLLVNNRDHYLLRFNKDTSFLNKPLIKKLLSSIPQKSHLLIDGSRSIYIDADIIDMLQDYIETAPHKNITVSLQKSSLALSPFFKEQG